MMGQWSPMGAEKRSTDAVSIAGAGQDMIKAQEGR